MFSILNCFRWQTKPKMFIHGELYYEVSLGCYVCSYRHNFLCSNLKKCTLSNLVSSLTLSQELGDLVAICALVSHCLWALLDSNPRSIFAKHSEWGLDPVVQIHCDIGQWIERFGVESWVGQFVVFFTLGKLLYRGMYDGTGICCENLTRF